MKRNAKFESVIKTLKNKRKLPSTLPTYDLSSHPFSTHLPFRVECHTQKYRDGSYANFGALGNAPEYISRTLLLERPDARPSTTLSEVHRRSRSSM